MDRMEKRMMPGFQGRYRHGMKAREVKTAVGALHLLPCRHVRQLLVGDNRITTDKLLHQPFRFVKVP